MSNMTTITLPNSALEAAGLTPNDVKTELAIHLYETHRLSLQQAADLAGMGWGAFVNLLSDRGILLNLEWSVHPGAEIHKLISDNQQAAASHLMEQRLEQFISVVDTIWKNVTHELGSLTLEALIHPEAALQRPGRRAIHHIERTIALFHDTVAIERGMFQLNYAAVDLASVIHNVIEQVRDIAEQVDIELDYNIADEIPYIWADATRLHRAFFNIIVNARFEWKNPDKINIVVTAEPHQQFVTIVITDNGVGEPAHFLEHWTRYGGLKSLAASNLGRVELALSYYLIELHGGVIQVEYLRKVGSRVTMTLPIHPERPTTPLLSHWAGAEQ